MKLQNRSNYSSIVAIVSVLLDLPKFRTTETKLFYVTSFFIFVDNNKNIFDLENLHQSRDQACRLLSRSFMMSVSTSLHIWSSICGTRTLVVSQKECTLEGLSYRINYGVDLIYKKGSIYNLLCSRENFRKSCF